MTTMTAGAEVARRQPGHYRDAVSAELTKFRSIRSTYWSLAVAAVLAVGMAVLIPAVTMHLWSGMSPADRAGLNPTESSLVGFIFGQLAIGVLGVLAITSEYSTGLIRTTLAAVPRRRTLLWAKATVVGGIALVSGLLLSLTSFLVGQAIFAGKHVEASLGDPGVARVVLGMGFYIGVIALVGLGLGTVIRHTAGTIVALVGIMFVIPIVIEFLPKSWASGAQHWMLSEAGGTLITVHTADASMSPARAVLVCLLWVGATLAAGALLISRRDA
jgi:ABC-2 type transport system permease protein